MITSKDAKQEVRDARKVIESDAIVAEKIKSLYKVIEVTFKVALTTRVNVVKVMEKLGVEMVKPRRPKDDAKETEPETTKE